jgi:PAS domain S-box-containing protein
VGSLSSISLASVLDQSVDCVKLISLDGQVQYMNANGLCAMEIDDFRMIDGKAWADLWPADARATILDSYPRAAGGEAVRFRAFCPTAKGTPRWWDVTVSAVNDEDGLAGYLSVSRDVTDNQASREALETAAAEMTHRLKNTYTMISSLVFSFARGDERTEAFARDMAERLRGLSTAQALFVSDDAPCEIARLIPALLAPFEAPLCPISIDSLDAVPVDQAQANAIALVIGELSVNSAKHGALRHGGSIHVTANQAGDELVLCWTEESRSAVEARDRAGGQGLRLMDRIVRARKGSIAFDWSENGLRATLAFPLTL